MSIEPLTEAEREIIEAAGCNWVLTHFARAKVGQDILLKRIEELESMLDEAQKWDVRRINQIGSLRERVAELEDDKAMLERSRESWQTIAGQHGEYIAELKDFMILVLAYYDRGENWTSNFLEQGRKLLEKGK